MLGIGFQRGEILNSRSRNYARYAGVAREMDAPWLTHPSRREAPTHASNEPSRPVRRRARTEARGARGLLAALTAPSSTPPTEQEWKGRARRTLQRAVRQNRVVVPSECELCGGSHEDGTRLHAHHADYRRPLEVAWLCRSCHRQIHRKPA